MQRNAFIGYYIRPMALRSIAYSFLVREGMAFYVYARESSFLSESMLVPLDFRLGLLLLFSILHLFRDDPIDCRKEIALSETKIP
jgi:hypothetical protein